MTEDNDTEIEILDSHQAILPGKSLKERFLRWKAGRQVKIIHEDPPQITIEPPSETGEAISAFYVSEATNQESARDFVASLRGGTPDILGEAAARENYRGGVEYGSLDLIKLANRWLLPVLLLRRGEGPRFGHWVLGLKEPEKHQGKWRILVYDPLRNGEDYQELKEWRGVEDDESLRVNQIFFNKEAWDDLREGRYNLSVIGDAETAARPELQAAKQARFQFNAIDCGPLCLYAAALRQGVKEGSNSFKFLGRERLHNDTGLEIKTRAELIKEIAVEG